MWLGFNLINIFCTAFTLADPNSVKFSQVADLLALLGSAGVKAARKNVGEIDPRSQSIYTNGCV